MNFDSLAILGGDPAFQPSLPVGQLYFPPWNEYEQMFRGIFEREYYTNQGPLVNQFEELLAEHMKVRNAVCVTNATIGLSMVADALEIKGSIVMPSFTFVASAQAVFWSNLQPVFCDVDPVTHHMDLAQAEQLLSQGAGGLMAVNLWGGANQMADLNNLANRYGVPLFFDSAHGFGSTSEGKPLGGFGSAEVFSFHATKVLSSGEGGCITTNDDSLAERLRNIRSSYGVRKVIPVKRTANGRMSEAQAALGLLSFKNFNCIVERNRKLFLEYGQALTGVPGLSICPPLNVETSNWQYLVCEIDEHVFGLNNRQLQIVLNRDGVLARRYFSPAAHQCPPFDKMPTMPLPHTEQLCARILQLPLGARTSQETVRQISALIAASQKKAGAIKEVLAKEKGLKKK